MTKLLNRFLDWLCNLVGLSINFDGNLMAPDPDEVWWINASDDTPSNGFGGTL
jgi:hypothetical protein